MSFLALHLNILQAAERATKEQQECDQGTGLKIKFAAGARCHVAQLLPSRSKIRHVAEHNVNLTDSMHTVEQEE
jgi:hypothetical protein